MSMHIIGDLGRIQTSVDIITPFLTYFVLQSDPLNLKLSNRFKKLYCLIAAGSVFLSFSRFLCFVFFVSLVLHVFTLRYFQQLKIWVLALAVAFIAVAAIGPSFVMEVVEKRFFSADNASSDRVRQEQVSAMMRVCDEHPFFGNGLGGYTQECIRDHEIPHAYEVQWVAFLMQFGLVGCMILLVPLGLIAWNFISYPWSRSKWGYFLLFCLWIFSGFTNPFLISLTSGIIYMMFWLIGQRLSAKSFLC